MNKKCITTVFTFLFFYVTVALVYAKSGHMYHKNLITFLLFACLCNYYSFCISGLSSSDDGSSNWLLCLQIPDTIPIFPLPIPDSALFYFAICCPSHTFGRNLSVYTDRISLFEFFSHFLYFFLSVDCRFFVLYGNLLHSANIKQLHPYPVCFTWSMSFMLHADFSLQNKQQLFPSSSELSGSHSLYGAPPAFYCMLL